MPICSITQNNLKQNKNTNANKSRRCLNSTTIDSIRKELVNLDWSDIVQFDNVELAYDRFLNKFNDVVSNKCSKGNHKKNSSPRKSWITFSLLRCINKKTGFIKNIVKHAMIHLIINLKGTFPNKLINNLPNL